MRQVRREPIATWVSFAYPEVVNRRSGNASHDGTLVEQASFQRLRNRLQIAASINGDALRELGLLPVTKIEATIHRMYKRAGEQNNSLIIVADGIAARCEAVHRANRQFSAIYLPGDICDPADVGRGFNAASLLGFSRSAILEVDRGEVMHLLSKHPELTLAFLNESSRSLAIASKWMANLGRKNAAARIGFLLCEVGVRMEKSGQGSREKFNFPATQEQIADMTGLTSVHVNRMIREMSDLGYLTIVKSAVTISEWQRLATQCDFDETYLH
jgi:CRP-like cAMP-binding protein